MLNLRLTMNRLRGRAGAKNTFFGSFAEKDGSNRSFPEGCRKKRAEDVPGSCLFRAERQAHIRTLLQPPFSAILPF
jgi:hypothetical protein